ncbi:C39 family peptidase [Ectobacillus ponti]|uniref:C39 family peptidase n=1 Tax=Ectobacillus ponti TaxID=2961894 RepID=A0AA42BQP0_9BACI|nr:C39 family peptidase [Ectobacillus ponti]MCP8969596.1 C39 family peptidase [Ectobacillus ponti]
MFWMLAGCSNSQILDVLQQGKDGLVQKVQEIQPVSLSKRAYIQNVPLIQQRPELPRGCEVTSLAMLLQYHGVQTDKMKLAGEIKKVPFQANGKRGHPNEGFVGSMYTLDEPGYGVYHTPIAQLAKTYVPERVQDLTGRTIQEVYRAVEQGSPVWVITNVEFQPLPDDEFMTWDTAAGPVKITYHEHSVVVVGYDEGYVYVNDPLASQPQKLSRAPFEAAWAQMGQQAIAIAPK